MTEKSTNSSGSNCNTNRFYSNHCVYLPVMLGWFAFSAMLVAYNKVVFGNGHMAFPCPLLLTSMHFLIQWIFAFVTSSLFPFTLGGDRVQQMSWKDFLMTGVPCGLVTSLDVGLSNLSLIRISITFYTMVKASTPIFVVSWAFILGIEDITLTLFAVVGVIAAGEFLTVLGEVEFDAKGFFLCLTASILSGARWTLVQLLLNKLEPPLKTTIATMRVLSPPMFISMFLISMIAERPWAKLSEGEYLDSPGEFLYTLGLGMLGAVFAIAMVLCEFSLIMNSNAIVLMIGGVIKEMVTIVVGVIVFHDSLNAVNIAGFSIVLLGVIMYKISFHLARMEEDKNRTDQSKVNRVIYKPVVKADDEKDGIWITMDKLGGDNNESNDLTNGEERIANYVDDPLNRDGTGTEGLNYDERSDTDIASKTALDYYQDKCYDNETG